MNLQNQYISDVNNEIMTKKEELKMNPVVKDALQRMRNGEPYFADSPEMFALRGEVKKLLRKLNNTEYYTDSMQDVVHELLPNCSKDIHIEPPFYCDYGTYIYADEGVFINFDCIILDGGGVYIGKKTLIAPGVHIYTAHHPLNADERDKWEMATPVRIGERCWIGGDVTICPGVTIGDRSVIGAGSVVVKDIPADCLAVGSPAKVIRVLNNDAHANDTH